MTKAQAGLRVLALFSAIDGHIDESEVDVAMEFIVANYERDFSLEEELRLLHSLTPAGQMEMLMEAVYFLSTRLSTSGKRTMLEYAWELISADGIRVASEKELFRKLCEAWNFDPRTIVDTF